ncbi:HDOD domain-containing protein [Pseudoflavonifractor sp. 60]|uniref:EAL and HDOD domain-containing protein n=1 Tax=Pseudoflavonifractor sp. 60 TaxID=2304576 RepID=UPI00191C11D2|nr:HDOD domain-containing protein [Pseudoflavonifractor sp. 60]
MISSKYIVRQPVKDLKGTIIGYGIQYYGENQAYAADEAGGNEFAAADTIYSFLTQNTDKVLKGSLNFMTFTTNLLMKQTPKLFASSDLVIQVGEDVIIHPLAMRFLERYAREGYKLAVNDFQFSPRYFSIIDKFDYIKINFQTAADVSIRNIVELAHSMGKKCIAIGVDTEELYQKAFIMEVDAMEGLWVAEKLLTAVHSSSFLQSSFFQLMVAINRDDPDVDEIERIISMDAVLTYSLLKIVNSSYFALRNRATDIHQAIVVMGLGQLRQWIYLLGTNNSEEGPDANQEEFLKLSFMRASFCSALMKLAKDMPISQNEAYLMGMFSTLNYLIAAPLEEILADLPIAQEVKDALLFHSGRCGELYDLVLSYERADWKVIGDLAEALEIPVNLLTNTYFHCLGDVNNIWRSLMESGEDMAPAPSAPAPQ